MNVMNQLFRCYWRVALLKESPANTPYAPVLMLLSALFFMMVMIYQWSNSNLGLTNDFAYSVLIALSLITSFVVYSFALLAVKGLSSRLVQTVTTLFLTHSLIHLCAVPLFIFDPYLVKVEEKKPLLLLIGMIYLLVTLALSVWQFAVTACIYKNALQINMIQAVLAAFGLVAINILTISFW